MRNGPVPHSMRYSALQNSLAHYNQILSIKPSVRNKLRSEIELAPNNHKYLKKVDEERRNSNNILLTKLIQIRDNPRSSLRSSLYDYEQTKGRKLSLKNEFKEREKEREINKNNMGLYQRIKTVKPGIGTMEQWRAHSHSCEQQIRMLRRSTEDQTSFDREVYSTFNDLMYRAFKTKFKLVNGGVRKGEPLKVEVECEFDKKQEKKFRRRKKKKIRKNMATEPMNTTDVVDQGMEDGKLEEQLNTEIKSSI